MDEAKWTAEPSSKHKNRKGLAKKQQNDLDTRAFLSSYKATRCFNEDFHDHRFCPHFHNDKDYRRDPYKESYLPDDASNLVEKIYHPISFRTYLCRRGNVCPFRETCSYAHTYEELRCYEQTEKEYEQLKTVTRELPSLGGAVADKISQESKTHSSVFKSYAPFAKGFNAHHEPSTAEFLPVCRGSLQWFMLQHEPFFLFLEEKALKNGLSRISRPEVAPKYGNQMHCRKGP